MWPFNTRQNQTQPELPQSKPARKKRTHNSTSEFKSETRSLTGLPTRILGTYGTGVQNVNINAVLRQSLTALRDASRSLTLQNPYARRYVQMSSNAVAGADGITVRPAPIMGEQTNQELADRLEKMFYEWASDASRFSLDGTLSFDIFQALAERTRATDGDFFIRIHPGRELQISVIDAARIPGTKNELLNNGSYISNGIERDRNGKVLAYHVADINPLNYTVNASSTERVPADEILHYFVPEYAGQERGFPDCISVFKTLEDFNSYNEAAVIQKKIASSAMGFVTNSDTTQDELLDTESEPREHIEYFEPGTIKELQPGQNIQTLNPTAGTDKITEFSDAVLTTISTGLGVPKSMLTGDTQNASFSAAKMADRISREGFKTRSNLLISKVLRPIYREFIKRLMVTELNNLSFVDFENIANCTFITVKPVSLDPVKDAQYEQILLNMGVKSRSQIIRDLGMEPQHVFEELEREKGINTTTNNEQGSSDGNKQNTETGDGTNE
ncbi:phage portal protein [Enterobacteriaceae bacterium ENNIH3]|nr:phage portal protein [Enterobacteriaceae bacterium ENNIH3]AUV08440.1 phage portal protein [Enterobacteriaceae bacterium ENNIH2]